MNDQKRFALAMVLSGLILGGYWLFFAKPLQEEARKQAQIELAAIEGQVQTVANPIIEPLPAKDRSELIAQGTRITIDTPSLSGSFSTIGSRFDDLRLKNYNQTIKKDSETVIMFSPEGAEHAAYVFDNWTMQGGDSGTTTPWSVVSGARLTPETPVTLEYIGDDFSVRRVINVDNNYLITLDDTLTNLTSKELTIVRKGASRQHGLPDGLTNFFILQEGPIAIIDDKLVDMKYKKLAKKRNVSTSGEGGWVGLTDQYWLAAAIAPQGQQITADFNFKNLNGTDVYEATYTTAPTTLSPGISIKSTGYIYAGAKRKKMLASYMDEENQGIARMDLAVDYGLLGLLTKPMSWALTKLGKLTGNFGVGILLLTLIIKIFLFPLNNKAYSSMAKMKALQPKIEKMKKRYGDDRVKLQQEMMAMYKKQGVSPVAGCLPMIPQMFIFFALYKSLFITLEMRHAPFVGWIKDLSAKDPLSILNGFGLFPWDAVPIAALSFFAIGPLALMYGGSMALTQMLNTPPADKTQARIFQYMPLFFMFILAPFATGLLVYWVWNNTLTFIQQYIITKKFGVETPLDRFFARIFKKPASSSNDT
jgi:YidC/Oxa1 family membrane protein insertase